MKKAKLVTLFFICIIIYSHCSNHVDPPQTETIYPLGIFTTANSEMKILEPADDFQFPRSIFYFLEGDSTILALGFDNIVSISTDFSTVDFLYNLPSNINDFYYSAISPDKKFLTFSSFTTEKFDLYLLDLKSLQLRQLTNTFDTSERYPRFSASGLQIIFTTERKSLSSGPAYETISILDLNTSEIDTLVSEWNNSPTLASRFYFPFLDDNSSKLFYLSANPLAYSDSLLTINLNNGTKNVLEIDCEHSGTLAISSDGSRIVYTKKGNPETLATISINGTDYHEITNSYGLNDIGFSVSEDGQKVLYWFSEDKTLYSIDWNGANLRVVSQGRNARFSSNLSFIAFTAIREK